MSIFNPDVWAKHFLISAVGEDTYQWWESKEYKELVRVAQALSPGKRYTDKRTKAYKYMKWHEPRARKSWERNNETNK